MLQLVHLQIDTMGLEPRVQLDVAGRSKNFLVDTGATYSVLTSYSGTFSSKTCTIWGGTGKTASKELKDHSWSKLSNNVGPIQGRTGRWTSPRCQFLKGINIYKS